MQQDNRSIVEKADTKLSTLAPGGILLSAQADKFIQLAIDQSIILPMMTRVDMKAPKELREKIQFGSRVLRKGTEMVALPLAQRVAPDTSKVELDAQLIKGECRISYEALEDSIEKGTFEQTVREALSDRASLDFEDLAFNGDLASADNLLSTLNGFIIQATTNIVAGGSATLQRSILKDTLKTMPSAFRRNKRALRYMTADEANIDYQDHLGDRATPLGDDQVQALESRPYQGIPVLGVPVFPSNLGGGTNETVMLLTDPANMLFGVWREIRVESDRDISAGSYIIVMTARVDFKFAHEPAVVRTNAVRAA